MFFDDVVIYLGPSETTDIEDPGPPSGVSATAGTGVLLNWTDGTDNPVAGSTGVQGVVILRRVGSFASAPSLNDQAFYTPASNPNGVSSVGGWEVIYQGPTAGGSFTDATAISGTSYTYAVYHFDLAKNYSTPVLVENTLLPVSFLSVEGERQNAAVRLEWKTASESENSGFWVARSTGLGDFQNIGFVPGENRPATYAFLDTQAPADRVLYRLAQVDFDGKTNMGPVVEVASSSALSSRLNVFPNPAASQFTLELPAGKSSLWAVALVDVHGRVVYETTMPASEQAVFHTILINGLPLGVYTVLATGNGSALSARLVIVD